MIRGQSIINCPNCGESKVQRKENKFIVMGFAGLLLGAFLPVIGWFIILPIGILFSLIGLLFFVFGRKVNMRCHSCKHSFIVSRNSFKEYKQALK